MSNPAHTEILYRKTVSPAGQVRYVPAAVGIEYDRLGQGWHLVGVGREGGRWETRISGVQPDMARLRAAFEVLMQTAVDNQALFAAYARPEKEKLKRREIELWTELSEMNRGRFAVVIQGLHGVLQACWGEIEEAENAKKGVEHG